MPEPIAATALHIPEPALADLRERLARIRFPDPAPGGAWTYGTDVTYMQELVEYWRSSFDWRAQEAQLNVFPQYRTPLFNIDRAGRSFCRDGTA
jgi:microsomal epoxide hydrolase